MLPLALALHLAAAQVPPVDLRAAAAAEALRTDAARVAPRGLEIDRRANSVGGLEVFTASAGALVGAVAALGTGLAAVGLVGVTANSGDVLSTQIAAGLIVGMVSQQVLTPLFAALGARLASDGPRNGNLNKALGYAFLAQGSSTLVFIVTALAASTSDSSALTALAFGLYAVNELVGVPLAASYGLHQGDALEPAPAHTAPAPPALPPPDAPPPMYVPPGSTPPPPPATVGFLFHF